MKRLLAALLILVIIACSASSEPKKINTWSGHYSCYELDYLNDSLPSLNEEELIYFPVDLVTTKTSDKIVLTMDTEAIDLNIIYKVEHKSFNATGYGDLYRARVNQEEKSILIILLYRNSDLVEIKIITSAHSYWDLLLQKEPESSNL